ncbi:MAG: hypothetical protein IJ563_01985 [Selenomonadaceae bacterium]|nr:hypothetical protein [Selenomonadaceae bacterium]MBR1857895.1 hypothetical protein [Selenomonadaceae bacterium]
MDESAAGLSPFLSIALTFLSIALSVMLLIAMSYLWSTRKQDRDEMKVLSANMKQLSKKVKELDAVINNEKVVPKVDTVPSAEPFGIPIEQPKTVTDKKIIQPWAAFLEDYNHIAESMAVPGQLRACENFVKENNLKILVYSGHMKFIDSSNVETSRFWAWQIEGGNKYAVVPNPMITYDEELHSQAGMKETFASNYNNGSYKRYLVKLPAILSYTDENGWQLSEPGVIELR